MASKASADIADVGPNEKRWWMRMRRAYGIPDLVSDDHAREAIIGLLSGPSSFVPNLAVKEVAIEVIVEHPQSGISGPARLPHHRRGSPAAHRKRAGIGRYGLSHHERNNVPPGGYAHDTAESLVKITESVLERLESHIKRNPFDDDGGGYFSNEAE